MRGLRVVLLLTSALIARPAGAQLTAAQGQAYNSDIVGLKTAADLVAKDLGFTALGEVTFALFNRGDVGTNAPPTLPAATERPSRSAVGAGPPIKVDVFAGAILIESIYHPALAGKATKVFSIKLQTNVPKCLDSRDLRVVVDAPNAVIELHDDNNVASATASRPCPDLAIKSIARHKQGVLGEMYTVKVTITNLGNAASPITQAWATTLSSAPGITGWPEFGPNEHIPALTPGQTYSFNVGGSVFSVENSWVSVFLDRHLRIEEPNEANNRMNKKI